MTRLLAATAVFAVLVAAAAVPAAVAADECRGLQVCLPVAGPWVVVPPDTPVEYELSCPLPGYVVAGVDVRLSETEIDVSFRGETGSPVGAGVTTLRAVLFTASSTAPAPRRSSFKPFAGCVPTSGGGGRAQTAYAATPGGLRPSRPLERVVVTRRVGEGTSVVRARCPRGARLLGGSHAVAFRTAAPPAVRLLAAVRVVQSVAGGAVVVAWVSVAPGGLDGATAEVQVHAVCRKAAS